MKLYQHVLVIGIISLLIYFLYDEGFGAIPFSLASVYLGYLSIKEFQRFKQSKRG